MHVSSLVISLQPCLAVEHHSDWSVRTADTAESLRDLMVSLRFHLPCVGSLGLSSHHPQAVPGLNGRSRREWFSRYRPLIGSRTDILHGPLIGPRRSVRCSSLLFSDRKAAPQSQAQRPHLQHFT